MPKTTFFRLSEEKQQRILDAAKKEFFRVPYNEASINKIIKNAEIPRGSFYQYFEDKQDIFLYAISEVHEKIFSEIIRQITEAQGDFFRFIHYYTNKIKDFTQSGEYGELMIALTDRETANMICGVVRDRNLYEKTIRQVEQQLVDSIDDSLLTVSNKKEQHYMMDIVGCIIRDSVFQIIQSNDHEKIKDLCNELCDKISLLERYFKR